MAENMQPAGNPPRNIQSGSPTAESTSEGTDKVASAAAREGTHYEPDPGQIVKVAHQVRPDALPVDSPTDYQRQGGVEDARMVDARVTPSDGSVHEAREADDPA